MRKQRQSDNLFVGIDIGTTKIVAIVAEVADDSLHVLGIGVVPSVGLKRGVVVNIEATVTTIRQAIVAAEMMSGCQIHSAFAGIAGSHIRSFNSHGIVAISNFEVSQRDINRVIEAAKTVPIPADQKILHILPKEFVIDRQNGILEPIGMSGVRLEVDVHIITGAVSAAENIIKCIRRCDLAISDIILEPLASSYAVLADDEKELGVLLIDIGGGTTDIAIFKQSAMQHSAIIPIAGSQVTSDISIALRTPSKYAEDIKLKHGCALIDIAGANDIFEIPSINQNHSRKMSRKTLAEVCEPRYEELFKLVRYNVYKNRFTHCVTAGVVLTGGGANMEGAVELAEKVFQLPVRLGLPRKVAGMKHVVSDPIYATSVGLLRYGYDQYVQGHHVDLNKKGLFSGLFKRMKDWFKLF